MNEYSERFSGIIQNYWSNRAEFVDSYNVSEYTESIDAGGETGETKEDSNGSVRFFAKTKYTEYNSLGMKWAYNSSTK